jgi:hypothetical protein
MGTPISKYRLPNDLVRVYDWDQKPGLGTQPKGYLTREDANQVLKLKFAVPCVKGFAIHMRPDPGQRFKKFLKIVIRGGSAQMGPRVIEGAAGVLDITRALEAHFKSLVEGWEPCLMAGSYCPLVPRNG